MRPLAVAAALFVSAILLWIVQRPAAAEDVSPSATPTEEPSPPASPTAEPSPEPSSSETPSETPSQTPSETPSETPTEVPSATPSSPGTGATGSWPGSTWIPPSWLSFGDGGVTPAGADPRLTAFAGGGADRGPAGPVIGTFSTAKLDAAAAALEREGWKPGQILERIYPPFIVRGPAAWTDTWHAARYAGGFHLHEGQDVFCRYGSPVLAATDGHVEFDTNVLGGRIARVRMDDGSYWYYAHLSAWNTEISSGAAVRVGDVIGSCGNSGDASASAPHVHFGWYDAAGIAHDPMVELIGWLREAEARLPAKLADEPVEPVTVPTASQEQGAAPTAPEEPGVITLIPVMDVRVLPERLSSRDAVTFGAAILLPLVVIWRRRLATGARWLLARAGCR